MDWAGILEKQNWLQIRTLMISLKLRSRPRSRAPRRPRGFSPSHKRNKIIARKIDSFLGAEANNYLSVMMWFANDSQFHGLPLVRSPQGR